MVYKSGKSRAQDLASSLTQEVEEIKKGFSENYLGTMKIIDFW